MFTPVTYTPAGIDSATNVVGDNFGSATYTDGNEPIATFVNFFILDQDGFYILNQDGSKIIWGEALTDLVDGNSATATTYIVGNNV